MLEAGLFGHQGSEAEWHIATRAFDLNIVTLTRPAGGDDSRPAIERYPIRSPYSSPSTRSSSRASMPQSYHPPHRVGWLCWAGCESQSRLLPRRRIHTSLSLGLRRQVPEGRVGAIGEAASRQECSFQHPPHWSNCKVLQERKDEHRVHEAGARSVEQSSTYHQSELFCSCNQLSITHSLAGAERLRGARVIIIDEVTMVNKDVFNYIDRTLRSLYGVLLYSTSNNKVITFHMTYISLPDSD